jgi:hypothetical protein
MAKRKLVTAPCNECHGDTDHLVLRDHVASGSDNETSWSTRFEMIECCGCHFISLKRSFDFSEYEDLVVEYFPPPVSRRQPNWGRHFLLNAPFELQELHSEIYKALHANLGRLACMGMRALLDMVILGTVGDVGRFDQKLTALETSGRIGKQQREVLEAALEAGNAAAHRGHCPTPQQLNQVMDIVESILQQVYVLPHVAAELKRETPPRKKSSQ